MSWVHELLKVYRYVYKMVHFQFQFIKKLNNWNSEKVYLVLCGGLLVAARSLWWFVFFCWWFCFRLLVICGRFLVVVCGCLLVIYARFLVVCNPLLLVCGHLCSFMVVPALVTTFARVYMLTSLQSSKDTETVNSTKQFQFQIHLSVEFEWIWIWWFCYIVGLQKSLW